MIVMIIIVMVLLEDMRSTHRQFVMFRRRNRSFCFRVCVCGRTSRRYRRTRFNLNIINIKLPNQIRCTDAITRIISAGRGASSASRTAEVSRR